MTPSLIMIDNFYGNPHDVRNFALSCKFHVTGNFPGRRTDVVPEPYFSDARKIFEKLLGKEITWWPTIYNSSFQYTTESDQTWVHYDPTNWAAVVYLTPNAPLEAGTAIYQHKQKKISLFDRNNKDTDLSAEPDLSNWDEIVRISNVFNRLIMYRGEYYHRSILPGFGKDQFDGRLFQTFFFNTKE